MKRYRAVFAALIFLLAVPGVAVAAPPANDLPGGAIAIPADLPQTIEQDTTEATITPDDDVGCGAGGQDQATVWYTFTPAADVDLLIDASASSYFVGINVFAGSPDSASLVDCFGPAGISSVSGGTLYYIMFADADENATNGGQLSATLDVAPPPIEVNVAIDPTGKMNPRSGTAILTGSITCSRAADFAEVDVTLRQRVGRVTITGSGFAGIEVCGPEPSDLWIEVFGDNGTFAGGKATAEVFAFACDQLSCGESSDVFSVRLRR